SREGNCRFYRAWPRPPHGNRRPTRTAQSFLWQRASAGEFLYLENNSAPKPQSTLRRAKPSAGRRVFLRRAPCNSFRRPRLLAANCEIRLYGVGERKLQYGTNRIQAHVQARRDRFSILDPLFVSPHSRCQISYVFSNSKIP